MPERKIARWKMVVGYVVFGFVTLIVSFMLTFPYETLKTRAQLEADNAGLYLRIGGMRPGFFGITATDVALSKKIGAGEEKAPEPLRFQSVSLRPTLFPPGVSASADAFGG